MNSPHLLLEKLFTRLAIFVTRSPWWVIGVTGSITLLFWINLPQLYIDVSSESFFHQDDPSFQNYENFQDQFGRDTGVVLVLESPELFDSTFLLKLKALHQDLEDNVPYLDEVTSLLNITATRGLENELVTQELLEEWPETPEAMQTIKDFVQTTPLYQNNIVSQNGQQTAIFIVADVYAEEGEHGFDTTADALDSGGLTPSGENPTKTQLTLKQVDEFVGAIEKITNRYRSETFPIYMAGSPVMDREHSNIVHNIVGLASIGIFLAIVVLLSIIYRRLSGVFLPVLVIALSFTTSLGFMGFMKIPLTLVSQIFPPLLLAFSVLDSVHLLTLFYKNLQQSHNKQQALTQALKQSGPALLFTSLTTATGFLSFYGAGMLPISDLGLLAPFGVLVAYGYTIFLLPALLIVTPIKIYSVSTSDNKRILAVENQMRDISEFAITYPKTILAVALCLAGLAFWGATGLRFSFNTLAMLPKDNQVRIEAEWIDQKMQSSTVLEVLVDIEQVNGLYDPVILKKLDAMNRYAERLTIEGMPVAKSFSVVDTLKQIHKSLNANDPEFYTIPEDPQLIAQEFFLFENGGADDLEDLVDSQFSMARVTIRVPNADAVSYLELRRQLQQQFETTFAESAEITLTGSVDLSTQSITNVMDQLSQSYLIAGIAITAMMIVFLTNGVTGLLSMIPNFFPIVLTLGIMGWLDFPINMMTLLGGSVALGLAVDDTLHFMYHFGRYYQTTQDAPLSVLKTIKTIGRALFFTTLIMTLGFLVFVFTPLNDLKAFGLFTGGSMVMALLSDLIIAPAIVTLVFSKKPSLSFLSKQKYA